MERRILEIQPIQPVSPNPPSQNLARNPKRQLRRHLLPLTSVGDAAEVKAKKLAVERKLRDLMDKPMAERKKALREMMLEYHPDKSSDEHAKEVFQFINASRSWFLAET